MLLVAVGVAVLLAVPPSAVAEAAATGWLTAAVPHSGITVQYPDTWSPAPADGIAEPAGKHNEFIADSPHGDVMVVATLDGKRSQRFAGLAQYTSRAHVLSRQVHGTVIDAVKTRVGDLVGYRSLVRYDLFGHPVIYGELALLVRTGTVVVVYATLGADEQAVLDGILDRVSVA
jgi:hypothetical protein